MNKSITLPPDPVFIVGYPRSGTTLLQALTATQERVYSIPETHFFNVINRDITVGDMGDESAESGKSGKGEFINPLCLGRVLDRVREKLGSHFAAWERNAPLHRARAGTLRPIELFESIVTHYLTRFGGADVSRPFCWVEKTPNHAYFLEDILSFYPAARFISIVRHPLAAIASRKNRFPYNRETPLPQLAHMWLKSVRCVEDFHGKYPEKIHRLRYEDLVADTEGEMQQVGRFLRIPIKTGLLKHHPRVARSLIHDWEHWKRDVWSGPVYGTGRDDPAGELPAHELPGLRALLENHARQYGYNIS